MAGLSWLSNKRLMIGLLILLLLLAVFAYVAVLTDVDPYRQRLLARLRPPGTALANGQVFYLGTDQFGRDVLARLIYGVRVPLMVAVLSAFFGGALGMAVGIAAGYFGGVVDRALSYVVDIQLSMPFILVALFVLALFGSSVINIILVFTLLSWPIIARVARVIALQLRQAPFIDACRASGLSTTRILVAHVLPNTLPPVIAVMAVQVSHFVLAEASLGFFGLGVPPPEPTWGNMLAAGRDYMSQAWWLNVIPGLCIVLLAGASNLFGEGLREVLDPKGDVADV
jgi:peptide/nickel transport system permease protein